MRATVLLSILVFASACGHHRPTVFLPATSSAATTSAAPAATPAPSPRIAAPASPAPVTSQGPLAQVRVGVFGPGPQRIDRQAVEVSAFAFEVEAGSSSTLIQVRIHVEGSLDDARDVRTARLALDTDGDGRFDRAVDRVVSTAGFSQDDGVLEFSLREPLPPAQPIRFVVALDLSGSARLQSTLRLRLDSDGLTLSNGPAPIVPAKGPQLRVGDWVTPHQAFFTPGDGLFPRAVRDAQGRTHVSLYQNHNGNSDVWYTLLDGRSYSPVDDVSRSSATSWNQDLAVDGSGLPHLVWEAWDNSLSDYAVRFSRFDAQAFRWTPSEGLSDRAGLAPRIAVAGGVVHVVWEGRNGGVFHRRRTASGWSSVAEISSASASARAAQPALCALPSGAVIALWAENDLARSEVRARALDTGAGYGALEVVATAPQILERPAAVAGASGVHAVFEWGGEIHYARRGPQGWLSSQNLSNSPGQSSEATLTLHGSPPKVQVVWIEDETGGGTTSTQVGYAEEIGAGFSRPELLTRGLGARRSVTIVSEGERLSVLWQDWSPGRQRVFTTWRDPSGWSASRSVVEPQAEPSRAALARTRAGALGVAYSLDAGGNREVWVTRGQDPSGDFERAVNVSRSAGGSYAPSLAAVGSNTLWAAWEEDTPQGFQIHAARGDSSGWSTAAAISSAGPAYTPRLASGAGALHAVWSAPGPHGRHEIQTRRLQGTAWGAIAALVSDSAADLRAPDVSLTPGGLTCVYEREVGGRREIWCATRVGALVSVAAVASSASGQYAPRLVTEGQTTVVTWVEDGRVHVATRPAGTSLFLPADVLNAGSGWSADLALSSGGIAGGGLWAVWEQWTGNQVRVLAAQYTAQGWSAAEPLDRSGVAARRVSALGTPLGGLEVIWSEPTRLVLRQRGDR
ncbi:MAG: hypothetical protein JKY65_00350 [Planctomycetes bacterium]|nr:hypothetical protein [Planctomycetota bacterium]